MATHPPQLALERALKFARTFTWVGLDVRKAIPASEADIDRYGTAGHADYWDVTIALDWPKHQHDAAVDTAPNVEKTKDETIGDASVELRVVCTATDIVYYEFNDGD